MRLIWYYTYMDFVCMFFALVAYLINSASALYSKVCDFPSQRLVRGWKGYGNADCRTTYLVGIRRSSWLDLIIILDAAIFPPQDDEQPVFFASRHSSVMLVTWPHPAGSRASWNNNYASLRSSHLHESSRASYVSITASSLTPAVCYLSSKQ